MRATAALLCLAAWASAATSGTIDTVAGTGRPGFGGDGGPATAALLREPFHCELDGAGDLLVADAMNGRIRRVERRSGRISTVAGDGGGGLGGEGGPATEGPVGTPYAMAADEEGDLYIVDQRTPVVRKVDGRSGRISILAGTGRKGSSGDGGPATAALLREPNDCCLDGRGGLLIADVADWRVRRVDLRTGVIATFAGTGKPARRPDRPEVGDGGRAIDAVIVGARAVCVDGRGNTFLCEREGNAIRKVDPSGIITTVAGTGAEGYSGDGGPAARATFRGPKDRRFDNFPRS